MDNKDQNKAWWAELVANPGGGKLQVVSAELLPTAVDEKKVVVVLRVRAADRVLELDMELLDECVVDATDEYDVVNGEFVEHVFDFDKPKEVARYFNLDEPDEVARYFAMRPHACPA